MKKSILLKAARVANYIGTLFAAMTIEVSAIALAAKIKKPAVRTIVQLGAIINSAFGWELVWSKLDKALYNKQIEAEHEEEEDDFLG